MKLSMLFFLLPFFSFAQTKDDAKMKPGNNFYPDSVWERVDNSDSFDYDKLQGLKKFIADSAATTGIMVVHKGKTVFEFGDIAECSSIASIRKSVLSMLYGHFIGTGAVKLSTTLEELDIEDIGGLLPVEKKATVKDLLTARSGVFHSASNGGDASDMAPARGTKKPGKFWLYNNWDFNAAGYILEKQTGKSVYELTDFLLANPLQMQDWKMSSQRKEGDTKKSKYLAYSMSLSTRDMARLGYLMLKKGRWKDRQILTESWVSTITSVVTPNAEAQENKLAYMNFGYGYLWWIWDKPFDKLAYKGAYTASGVLGQFITVLPELDLVIAHKTKIDYQRGVSTDLYLRMLDKLLAAKID